ncbi:MAG: V-type ATPase subunit [Acutalibacteraceae bacterium]
MKQTDYAYCVARLRARESTMLRQADYDRLLSMKTLQDCVSFLREKKWIEGECSPGECIAYQSRALWQVLQESVPDRKELDILCLINDYFNIKAAVKCHLTGRDASAYYVYPTTLDTQALTKSVNSHEFFRLPGAMGERAAESYQRACVTENGQSADIILDAAAVKALHDYAGQRKKGLAGEVCAFLCDTANIKIALRCAKTNKKSDFIETAISDCVRLRREELISHCLEGQEALMEYLLTTPYSQGAEQYQISGAAYDKWCDDGVIDILSSAKYSSFGFAPVCAYYYAKMNEIRNVRIILTAVESGADMTAVRERMRSVYV